MVLKLTSKVGFCHDVSWLDASPLVLWDSSLWKGSHQMENYWESHSYTFQEALVDHVHPLFQPCKVLNAWREEKEYMIEDTK